MIKLNRTQKFQVFLPYKKIAKPLEVMGPQLKQNSIIRLIFRYCTFAMVSCFVKKK